MLDYIKYVFKTKDASQPEQLIALLHASDRFTGFEELENGELWAYSISGAVDDAAVQEIVAPLSVDFSKEVTPQQNWNALWEANFPPVVLGDFCGIRADFHQPIDKLRHEIIITPKMSFGTGHHATTKLMMGLMKDLDFTNKTVFDYGTGTGILAILARKMGASEVLGIDIDEWSYTNALENVAKNEQQHIEIQQGTLELLGERRFDIILANINRQILMDSMAQLSEALMENGYLLLSGILKDQDADMIIAQAEKAGMKFESLVEEKGWAACKFIKK